MANRDRTSEILEIKRRNPRSWGHLSWELMRLKSDWEKAPRDHRPMLDYFPIKCVTILEVSTRQELALLIDHSDNYADRAGELWRNSKLDFSTIRDIHGKRVTLGELVAHTVPVNSFGQMISHFEVLLGRPLRLELSTQVDRWKVEIERQPSQPIISDFEATARTLSALFDVRHILCHELPESSVYSAADIGEFIQHGLQFLNALEWILTREKWGVVPLTQTEMNIAEANELHERKEELDRLIGILVGKMEDLEGRTRLPGEEGGGWVSAFNDAQHKWQAFRDAYCDFVTYLNQGGTIRPLLWASQAREMTEARTSQLKAWFEYASKQLAFEPDDAG